jgi:hypothetical protein
MGKGGSGQEGHIGDGSSQEDGYPAKGMTDLAGKVEATVNLAEKTATATDPTKAMKERATWRVQPDRGLR